MKRESTLYVCLLITSLTVSQLALAEPRNDNAVMIDGVARIPATVIEHPQGQPTMVFLPEAQEEKIRNNRKKLASHGYIEKLDQPTRAEYVKARMDERRAMANLHGRGHSLEALGFAELDTVAHGDLPFAITLPDDRYIKSNSRKYLLLGGHKLKQLYTKTDFGTLIIDEMPNSTVSLPSANMEIGNRPATFMHVKHKGSKWASVVYATAGDRLLVVEADRRLTGKKKDAFIDMVSDLAGRSW